MSALRAAKDYGQRPTAMLLHDPYALHRHWWDPQWKPDETSRDWTAWDYVLADVFQIIQDFTDGETGQLMWYDQSGEVHWDVDFYESGSRQALAQWREHNKEDGLVPFPVPVFRDPDNKPTLTSWLKEKADGVNRRVPSEHRGARPPTPEERAALKARARMEGEG